MREENPQDAKWAHLRAGFGIAGWWVEPARNRIARGAVERQLEAKVMDALVGLAAAGGKTLGKEDLFQQIWPGVVVVEGAIYRAIGELRAALEDDARRPTHSLSADPGIGKDPASHLVPASPAIAVLPFIDLSETRDQAYFADGLSEELIDILSQITGLRVPSRTSSFSFKGRAESIESIARQLRVTHLLEGSVRRSGDRLRVTAQLIRADTGYHMWSTTYDRSVGDIFDIQDEIASAVVGALELKLLPAQQVVSVHRTKSTEAYNQYLLGRQLYYGGTTGGFARAAAAYQQAIALDPQFAAAYAGLAEAGVYLVHGGDVSSASYQLALRAADKAILLAPDQAEGYAARGLVRELLTWDWAGARADLDRAIELEPNKSTAYRRRGMLLGSLGQLPASIAALRRAAVLDPLIEGNYTFLALYLSANGDHAAARAALERALDALIRTHGTDRAYLIGAVYAWYGARDQAFRWLERAYQQRNIELTRIKVDPILVRLHGDSRYDKLLWRMNLPL